MKSFLVVIAHTQSHLLSSVYESAVGFSGPNRVLNYQKIVLQRHYPNKLQHRPYLLKYHNLLVSDDSAYLYIVLPYHYERISLF
mgnify:CR=1 FL=1